MNILALDDEEIALEGLVSTVKKAEPSAVVYGFRKPKEALEFCRSTPCEVALLDIQMRKISGVELAKEIKLLNPDMHIIFTTGNADYMRDGMGAYTRGYLVKPVTLEKVRKELDNLDRPIQAVSKNRVRFQTFGNFEMFIDGQAVQFKDALTKEMLAYLVDLNGALCANSEVMKILRPDRRNFGYFRSLIKDLKAVLGKECKDIIFQQRGKIGIVPKKVDCDYYDWLDGQIYAINLYRGKYMAQYSWSKMTRICGVQNTADSESTKGL